MRLWIDCEFNSYKGQLMSLALVGEGDVQFYAVLPLPDEIDPWVQTNVVPILGAKPTPYRDAQDELETFLAAFDSVHIVADWPEDIAHFCDFLITGPGQRIDTPPLTMEVVRVDAPSKVPHNALWDAIGIRDFMLAEAALSHAAGQDGEQCRAASGDADDLALTLERMADNAYCDYIRKMQRTECLGWEEKVRRGSFDSENLRAHVNAGELLGRHRALHEAAKLLRALSRGVPEGM